MTRPDLDSPMFSVAVCTYDRPDLLALAIESVLSQTGPNFELLVIDNHPKQKSRQTFERLAAQHPRARYVHEPRVGLSHARNRALREAAGRYVVYIDDDARMPEGYLRRAAEIAREHKPDAFGGPYRPWYLTDKPPWYRDVYGAVAPDRATGILPNNEYLFGANMAFRRDALPPDAFDPALGMAGERMAYGEETAVQKAMRERDLDRILFDRDLPIFHLVPDWKMRLPWRLRSQFMTGRHFERSHLREGHTDAAPAPTSPARRWADLLLAALSVVRSATLDLIGRDRRRRPFWQQHIYEHTAPRMANLGVALERVLPPRRTKEERSA